MSFAYTLNSKFENTESVKYLNDQPNERMAGWRVASLPFPSRRKRGDEGENFVCLLPNIRSTSEPVLITLQ